MSNTETNTTLRTMIVEEGARLGLLDTAIEDALLRANVEAVSTADPHDVLLFLRQAKREKAPHWFKVEQAPRYRSQMSAEQKAGAITELGMEGYLALPLTDTVVANAVSRDASGRFTSQGLKRSTMTPADKAAYITKHGADAYLQLQY
jgi:hypothetical protein